ncbi:MAG: RDD family protein [Planctomycetota bacterium]
MTRLLRLILPAVLPAVLLACLWTGAPANAQDTEPSESETAEATGPTEPGILAVRTLGTRQGQVVVLTSAVRDRDDRTRLAILSDFRLREPARQALNFQSLARYPLPVLAVTAYEDIGGKAGELAVLLDTTPADTPDAPASDLRFVFSTGEPFSTPTEKKAPMPPAHEDGSAVVLLDIAADRAGGRLLAVDQRANLWSLPAGETTWQRVTRFDLGPLDAWDLATNGRHVHVLAQREGLAAVYRLDGDTLQTIGSFDVAGDARPRLVDGDLPGGPLVLLTSADSDQLVRFVGEAAQFTPVTWQGDAAALSPDDPRGAGVALGSLRLIRAISLPDDSQASNLRELTLDPLTLQPLTVPGDDAGDENGRSLTIPDGQFTPPGGGFIQLFLFGLIVFALLSLLRQKPPEEQQIANLRDVLAPNSRRFMAGLIDTIPLISGYGVQVALRPHVDDNVLLLALLATVVTYIGAILVLELASGRSVGKMVLGLRVATVDGEMPTRRMIVLRNLFRLLDGPGLVLILFTPLRQRLGDVLATTVVVMATPVEPSPVDGDEEISA